MSESEKLSRFEQELITSLMTNDSYDHIMDSSICLRTWQKEGFSEAPKCDKCGHTLEVEYLAFRQTTAPKEWVRICRNRVGCRNYQVDPIDPDAIRAGSTWFRRVYNLYMNVTF